MKDLVRIVEDLTRIYQNSGSDAQEYLSKARKLEEVFGSGPAIVYCWFYSVPQKWTQVEPKIFDLMRYTNSFDLDVVLSMPSSNIASKLKPMIFHYEIASQLKNFCLAIRSEHLSWSHFADALRHENIFRLFKGIRKNRNVRVTFKNLAAMKSFVGLNDNLMILDTHVAKTLGIPKNELSKIRTHESSFKNLLKAANDVTILLRNEFSNVSTIKWSLAVWFYEAKIHANQILGSLTV